MLKMRLILSFSLLFASTANHAADTWFSPGDLPVWDGRAATSDGYVVQFKDQAQSIIGRIGIGVGGKMIGEKNVRDAGLVGFNFTDPVERKRLYGRWHELRPSVYITRVKVWLDEALFFEDRPTDFHFSQYNVSFPYAPARFDTEAMFSNGRTYKMGIDTSKFQSLKMTANSRAPEVKSEYGHWTEKETHEMQKWWSLVNPDHDTRKHPVAAKEEWNTVVAGGSSAFVRHCISSPVAGPIKTVRAILHKHPVFSPESDKLLAEATVHLPVYEIYIQRFSYLSELRAGEDRYKDQTYTITGECETAKGKKFTSTRNITIPRDRRPHNDGISDSGTFILPRP